MNYILSLLLLLFSVCPTHVFAQNAPTKPQKQDEEQMPESFRQWEQENAGREVAEESRYGALWNKTLLLLIVMLLILFAGTWYLKKFGIMRVKDSAGQATRIQLLEKRVISPKAVIYLLSIDGQKVAISETSTGIQVLKGFDNHPIQNSQLESN